MCAKFRSFAPISLTIACSRYIYNGVILYAYPVRGESHNQRNTTGEVATVLTPAFVVLDNICSGLPVKGGAS